MAQLIGKLMNQPPVVVEPMGPAPRRTGRRSHKLPARAAAGEGARYTGTLLRVNTERGFGFIRPDNPKAPEYFCHIKAFAPRVCFVDGQRVSFIPGAPHTGPGRKSPAAVGACALSGGADRTGNFEGEPQ